MAVAERVLAEIAGLLDKLYAEAIESLDVAFTGAAADRVAAHSREAGRLRRLVLEKATEFIARYQPMASELRRVTAYMEASYDLFRVTRYALETARLEARIPEACGLEEARRLYRVARGMLEEAYTALRRGDATAARRVIALDEEIDRSYLHMLDMLQVEDSLTRCQVAELLVVRHLERIADHAVYIASAAHYVATGRRLEEA